MIEIMMMLSAIFLVILGILFGRFILENEIKTLKTTIVFSKKGYDDAKELMTKAVNIDKFKMHIINYVKEDVNKNIKEQYHFLANNNEKKLNLLMELTLKQISEKYDEEMTNMYSFYASIVKVLLQKNLLSMGDIGKISQFSDEIREKGFDKINKSLIEEVKKL